MDNLKLIEKLRYLDEENKALQRELQEYKNTLEKIYRSRGWRALKKYYVIKWYVIHYTNKILKRTQIAEGSDQSEYKEIIIRDTRPTLSRLRENQDLKSYLSIDQKTDPKPLAPWTSEKPLSSLRILIITPEIAGPIRSGGIGTAFYELAKCLSNAGARTSILYVLGEYSEELHISTWIDYYESFNVELIPLRLNRYEYVSTPTFRQIAHKVYLWLKENHHKYDIVIGTEWLGSLYYVLTAKRHGLHFTLLPILVNTHGPLLWTSDGNYWLPENIDSIDRCFLERRSIELADYVVSPSKYLIDWMKTHNFCKNLNNVYIIPNCISISNTSLNIKYDLNTTKLTKLIFFGRPEPRKGLDLFIRALKLLEPEVLNQIEEIIFLGKPIKRPDFDSMEYLRRNLNFLPQRVELLSLQRDDVFFYLLSQREALVVIPSLIENSPYTVVELLHLGIPFIASKVGGIPELIHPDDIENVLFEPLPSSLANKIKSSLLEGVKPAKPARSPQEIQNQWINLIKKAVEESKNRNNTTFIQAQEYPLISVCISHYERPNYLNELLESLLQQTYKNFEIIICDDGSRREETHSYLNWLEANFTEKPITIIRGENRYLGSARNRSAQRAKGELLLFMDDDNLARPKMLEVFVNSYLHSRGDVYTCFNILFNDSSNPNESLKVWLPAGGDLGSGLFINSFGDANFLIRNKVFEEIGGFSEDYGLGYEDWEILSKLMLNNYRLEIIPEPLYYYRVIPDSMYRTVDDTKSQFRRLRPLLYMDLKGLGVGLAYGVRLYLETQKRMDNISTFSHDDAFETAKHLFKIYWQKAWFRAMIKTALRFMRFFK